jgi:hypothetical protein
MLTITPDTEREGPVLAEEEPEVAEAVPPLAVPPVEVALELPPFEYEFELELA